MPGHDCDCDMAHAWCAACDVTSAVPWFAVRVWRDMHPACKGSVVLHCHQCHEPLKFIPHRVWRAKIALVSARRAKELATRRAELAASRRSR